MKTNMLTMVRRAYSSPAVPQELNRRNQRHLVRAIRFLGPQWLFAKPIAPLSPDARRRR